MDALVRFRAKAHTDIDGVRYVKLIEPGVQHIDTDRMVTAKAVSVAWNALFGHDGRVSESDAMVESFGDGFMPTVVVNLRDVSTITRFKRDHFPAHVDAFRAAGCGLIESEDMAHDAMRRHVTDVPLPA